VSGYFWGCGESRNWLELEIKPSGADAIKKFSPSLGIPYLGV